jgi:hypothetical protein
MPIASYIQKYFWEIDPARASPRSHPDYYIQRILEYGDERAFTWLMAVYGKKKIRLVSRKVKLTARSRNYWRLML